MADYHLSSSQWLPTEIPNRWAWILDVLFGGILMMAFEELEKNLAIAWDESFLMGVSQGLVAFCLCVFFLYDVVVYHFLIHTYPYRISWLSAARSLLDVLMAFCLMKVVLPGVRLHPEQHLLPILIALSLWHLSAALWHLLANWDHFRKPPPVFAFVPHLLFVAFYWTMLAAGYAATRTLHWQHGPGQRLMLMGVSAIVLGVSVYRSHQLLGRLRDMADAVPQPVSPMAPPSRQTDPNATTRAMAIPLLQE